MHAVSMTGGTARFAVLCLIVGCFVLPAAAGAVVWNVSHVQGGGNYTGLLNLNLSGDDTIRIWGDGVPYEGGITIDVPDVTIERWEGSPERPIITNTSHAAPAITVEAGGVTLRGLNVSGNHLVNNTSFPVNGSGVRVAGTNGAHLQGFTVTDCVFIGNAVTGAGLFSPGGAMYLKYVDDSRIADTTFTDNTAGGSGGGAAFSYSNNAALTNTTLASNTASGGGGAWFENSDNVTLTNTTFANNTATGGGGGVWFEYSNNISLTSTAFTNNTATGGGGGAWFDGSAGVTLTDTAFTSNTAESGGGAWFGGSAGVALTRTIFTSNTATCGGGLTVPHYPPGGGGAWFGGSDGAALTDTAFVNNTVAIGDGGGAYFFMSNGATLTGTTFTNNTAQNHGGGACFNESTGAALTDTAFAGNTAERGGGAAFGYFTGATLTNAAFAGNAASIYGGGVYLSRFDNATLTDAAFTDNTAGIYGGGACFHNANNITLLDTAFTDNRVNVGGVGDGAVFSLSAGAVVTNCRFDNPTNIHAEILEFDAVLNGTRSTGPNIAGGPYLGGNLWLTDPDQNISEWGADADFDGICDEAFTIAGFGTDYFPLVYGGTAEINSTPAGASIHLDGAEIARTTNTSLYLPVGNHDLTVALDGYSTPENRTVMIPANETTAVSFALEPVTTPTSRSHGSGVRHSDVTAGSASNIPAGGQASIRVEGTAIYVVTVTAAERIPEALITIEKKGLPSGIAAPAGTVYEYAEVIPYRTTDAALAGAALNFTVPKTWLEERGFAPENVVLYRYHNGAWQPLPTEMTGEDADRYFFGAESPGFSFFAIAAEGESVTPTGSEPTAQPTVTTVTSIPIATNTPAGETPTPQQSPVPWGLAALAAGMAYILKKKRL